MSLTDIKSLIFDMRGRINLTPKVLTTGKRIYLHIFFFINHYMVITNITHNIVRSDNEHYVSCY